MCEMLRFMSPPPRRLLWEVPDGDLRLPRDASDRRLPGAPAACATGESRAQVSVRPLRGIGKRELQLSLVKLTMLKECVRDGDESRRV